MRIALSSRGEKGRRGMKKVKKLALPPFLSINWLSSSTSARRLSHVLHCAS